MKHERQVALLKQTFAHIDANTTPLWDAPYWNPATRYTCPDHFQRELDTLFSGKVPLLAGFSPDLPAPGAWFTCDLPGAPIFLTRTADGSVKAFLNICRHRGSRLVGFALDAQGHFVEHRGQSQHSFSCPYHAWTYDNSGSLVRHANDMGGFAQLQTRMDCGQFNLIEVPCLETGGMLLVRPQGNEPIDAERDTFGMHSRMDEFGFGNFHFYQEVFWDFAANWKLLLETFMEGYHIAALHRNTLAPRFRCYPVIYECFGPHALFPLPRKSINDQRDLPESEWSVLKHASTIFSVSPHAVLNIPMDGHMELWDFQPLDVGRTRARVRFYIPEPIASEADAARWNKSWKVSTEVISGEDFTQQQNIHINLASGRIPGVVFGQNEPMLSHFHRELGKLTGVPDASLPASFF
jgi:phenylpropionate dioxygenase-like ring-hydroxylating dioxygenase large terminal subunit